MGQRAVRVEVPFRGCQHAVALDPALRIAHAVIEVHFVARCGASGSDDRASRNGTTARGEGMGERRDATDRARGGDVLAAA